MTAKSPAMTRGGGSADDRAGSTITVEPRPQGWVDRHRFLTFVALAYAISWSLWLASALGGGRVPFLLGALGPGSAAAIVTTWTGQSLLAWIRPVWRWRAPVRWWIYALGLPALLYAVVTLIMIIPRSA